MLQNNTLPKRSLPRFGHCSIQNLVCQRTNPGCAESESIVMLVKQFMYRNSAVNGSHIPNAECLDG
jgi:hypothetical protein